MSTPNFTIGFSIFSLNSCPLTFTLNENGVKYFILFILSHKILPVLHLLLNLTESQEDVLLTQASEHANV